MWYENRNRIRVCPAFLVTIVPAWTWVSHNRGPGWTGRCERRTLIAVAAAQATDLISIVATTLVGNVIAARYRMASELGNGRMLRVYLAEYVHSRRKVARFLSCSESLVRRRLGLKMCLLPIVCLRWQRRFSMRCSPSFPKVDHNLRHSAWLRYKQFLSMRLHFVRRRY